MINFTPFIYFSCTVLFMNMAATIKIKNTKIKYVVITNSVFAVLVSTLSLFYSGIYVDENNLSGDPADFTIAVVNILVFLFITLYSFIKLNEEPR